MDRIDNPMTDAAAIERHYRGDGGKARPRPARGRDDTAYAMTERRLYAFPILRQRVEDGKEELMELETMGLDGLRHHDRSIVRLVRPGLRVSEEEAHTAQMASLRGRLAADEMEVKKVQRALNAVCGDYYYPVIEMKYFKRFTDEDCSERLRCDPSTVRRHRLRLVKTLALWLYGVEAMEPG